ncbi:diablo IAP-binding mitochondrial protein-like [Neosynchiropus ocellatus]
MQAVRQCSTCGRRAAGALLKTELLHSTKTRGVCTRLLSNSEKILFSKSHSLEFAGWKDAHTSSVSSNLNQSLYAVPFTQQVENLSHDSLIKRAASVVTDSSNTFLSQATLAFIDTLTDHSKVVHRLIALQRRYLSSVGKMTPAEEDSLKQVVNGQRQEVRDSRDECKRYESMWTHAVNLCKMSAESAYMSGAVQACLTVRTNIQMAQSQVEEAQKMSAKADKRLAEIKVEEIQRMAEYAASFDSGEEMEIHEAYLRED